MIDGKENGDDNEDEGGMVEIISLSEIRNAMEQGFAKRRKKEKPAKII